MCSVQNAMYQHLEQSFAQLSDVRASAGHISMQNLFGTLQEKLLQLRLGLIFYFSASRTAHTSCIVAARYRCYQRILLRLCAARGCNTCTLAAGRTLDVRIRQRPCH